MEVRTMSVSSPIAPGPVLPRGGPADYVPSVAEREHAQLVVALQKAITGLVAHTDDITPAERAVVVAEALADLELDALGWCEGCQAMPEGMCYHHYAGLALADAFRRHAYMRLPGRPLIDAAPVSAELEARRSAAAALIADFRAEVARHSLSQPADGSWALRLALAVEQLLGHAPEGPGSLVRIDGSDVIAPADMGVLIRALRDAREFSDPASGARYASLARTLGDED
jgi:hypothetical protein